MAATIQGTLTDRDGTGIENAFVEYIESGSETVVDDTRTDANGDYSADVPADTYDVRATKLGYEPVETTGITVTDDSTKTVDLQTTRVDYGVRGELTDPYGVGVLGRNEATTGVPIGVLGYIPNDTDGYGLASTADARIEGTIDTARTDFVVEAGTTNTGYAQNVVLGHASNQAASDVTAGTIGGGGFDDGSTYHANVVTSDFGTIGGGRDNTVDAEMATIGGGDGNTAGEKATVGGGHGNTARGREATISGGKGNTANRPAGTIGGGNNNTARVWGSTIGGGRDNTGKGLYATVGGGEVNTASGRDATVAGGHENTAGGTSGGVDTDRFQTVAGGFANEVTAYAATVAGGQSNRADGSYATVPGGRECRGQADDTFAAGRLAKARSAGSFVWGDHSSQTVEATAKNEVVFQAGGGMTVYTDSNTATHTGALLPSGSGSWSSLSSKVSKDEVAPVDPVDVLTRVESLEIATWCYDTEESSTRHMGPMAEDFHDAFGLGQDSRHIATVDADGVALAAIQGLSKELDAKEERIEELAAENDQLRERLSSIEDHIGLDTGSEQASPAGD